MIHHMIMTADEAIEKLKSGNMRYLLMNSNSGNVSAALRKFTYEHGQHPHAIIVTCSDSRVIPETIFSAGLGELGSIEYAAGHLGSPVVVVLGHTHCGAVDAAINSDPEGYIKFITDEIKLAIGDETDDYKACCLNVKRSVALIEHSLDIQQIEEQEGLRVVGAMYHIEDGSVEFL